MVKVMEHLEHQTFTDLGSHEAYGTAGESHCFCGLAPLLDMNRMEPMMSVLEDKCLHLRSNNVVEYRESYYKSPFILWRSILCLYPHLHPTLCKSLPKTDEQEPVSPAECCSGKGNSVHKWACEHMDQMEAQDSVLIFWTLIVPISSVTWKKKRWLNVF